MAVTQAWIVFAGVYHDEVAISVLSDETTASAMVARLKLAGVRSAHWEGPFVIDRHGPDDVPTERRDAVEWMSKRADGG